MSQKESHLRSLLKALSWRLLATITTFLLALFIFRDAEDAMEKAGAVAGLEFVLKLLLYYGHERLWQQIPRGSIRQVLRRKKGE